MNNLFPEVWIKIGQSVCGLYYWDTFPLKTDIFHQFFPFNNPIVSFIVHKKMCRRDRKWLSYISWLLSCSVSLHCPADDWQLCNQLQTGFSGSTSHSLINYWRHFSLLHAGSLLSTVLIICISWAAEELLLNWESAITCTHTRKDEEK